MKEKINLNNLPKPYSNDLVKLNFEKFDEKNPQYFKKINGGDLKIISSSIFGNSPYLSDIIIKNPEFYTKLFEEGFETCFNKLLVNLRNFASKSEEDLMHFLRTERQKASLLIALAEISKLWPLEITTQKLSEFADLAIFKACEFLLKDSSDKKIIKLKDVSEPLKNSGLVVISLGKLGSNELNYSSDIDLAIFYEDEKLEYLGRKSLAQFYIELAQNLTKILSERTRDGYVFRVDMRLRPDPGANPLAVGLKKAEKYYFTIGQNWERAAMIKSRFVCGDKKSGDIFCSFMDKNVWRKSLDFETIEDIHSIKRQIDTRQGIHPNNLYGYNVKLGKGGIREVEFYAQTQQLIWGGRKLDLRRKKTSDALFALVNEGEINLQTAKELEDAYKFYRMVEHRLQMVNDEQTHTLPKESEEMQKIAVFCGFENSESFLKTLHDKINIVRNHYSKLFETSPSLASDLPEASGSLIFTGTENHPDTLETLKKMGFNNPNRVSDIVRGWHHGRYQCTVKKRARAELTKLMPFIFSAFAKSPDPDQAFIHFDEFLSKLPETSQIFSMLYVNQELMELLAEVLGGYPELADNLSKNPVLIEYVLYSEFYKKLADVDELQRSLEKEIAEFRNNEDETINAIKNWANDRKFRIGVQLVKNNISSEQVFLGLSNIAEVVLRVIINLVQKDFEKTYGKYAGSNFAAIAFGKLGSRELTFNSDLDLVFIYDFKNDHPKISASSYYTKMVGKIVSLLSSITSNGKLYEVDMRLRPLGESGPIACSYKSFNEYYNPDKKEGTAWIFEYMALTRARVISNNKKFETKLQKLIKSKLKHKWDEKNLNKEAKFIYQKFRQNKKEKNEFDIKNAKGGFFDLEFMLRYLQLLNMHKTSKLYSQSTTKLISALLKASVISKKDYEKISDAYLIYKEIQNILRITSEEKITKYTEKILCKNSECKTLDKLHKKLENIKNEINKVFEKYMEI